LSGLRLPVVLGISRVELIVDDEIALQTGKSTDDFGQWLCLLGMRGIFGTCRRRQDGSVSMCSLDR
jgi:hypothetical protein